MPSPIETTKPVQTGDGREAMLIDFPGRPVVSGFPLYAMFYHSGGSADFGHFTLDGTIRRGPARNNIVNVPPPFDPEAPAWTEDGRRAELFSASDLALEFPLTYRVKDRDGRLKPVAYTRTGKSRRSPHVDDLTNKSPRSAGPSGR